MRTILSSLIAVVFVAVVTLPASAAVMEWSRFGLEINLPDRWKIAGQAPYDDEGLQTLVYDDQDIAHFFMNAVPAKSNMTFVEWAAAVAALYNGGHVYKLGAVPSGHKSWLTAGSYWQAKLASGSEVQVLKIKIPRIDNKRADWVFAQVHRNGKEYWMFVMVFTDKKNRTDVEHVFPPEHNDHVVSVLAGLAIDGEVESLRQAPPKTAKAAERTAEAEVDRR